MPLTSPHRQAAESAIISDVRVRIIRDGHVAIAEESSKVGGVDPLDVGGDSPTLTGLQFISLV